MGLIGLRNEAKLIARQIMLANFRGERSRKYLAFVKFLSSITYYSNSYKAKNHKIMTKNNLFLTIDVEDWFQVETFSSYIKRETWDGCQLRIEQNINKILQILDEFSVKATFFTLGWIASKVPNLISEISRCGHEVACHGFSHQLIYNQTPDEFRDDVIKSKYLLEEITGKEVIGYRAPTFSITDFSLPILKEAGFKYDSSLVITSIHDLYGSVSCAKGKKAGDFFEIYPDLFEFSLPCISLLGKEIPWGGGGYFRLFPREFFWVGLEQIISSKSFVFYVHPWEFDPNQPRVKKISFSNKFRHYVGLNKVEQRFRSLLSRYRKSCLTLEEYYFGIKNHNCLSIP